MLSLNEFRPKTFLFDSLSEEALEKRCLQTMGGWRRLKLIKLDVILASSFGFVSCDFPRHISSHSPHWVFLND